MFYNRRHWGGYSIREREQPEARKFVENPDLPSPEVMTKLLNLYFIYVHPFAPVFVWSKFLKRLQNRDYSPSFLFVLNSIFALASRFSDDLSFRTDPTKPQTIGVKFAEKAKAILDTIYDAPDMYCVGGLVILSYQQMGTGGGYRAWMFIGLAIRMAQHLGLHRDCMKLNPHMPALDREERNRIWWACFVADRLVSATFGGPQGINEHDVDATYPEGIDEENTLLEYRLDNAPIMLTGPSPHSEKNFVYLASLTRIMGRVLVSLYSPLSKASSLSSLSMTNPAPLEQLDKELTDWLLTLPPHLQFRSVQQEPGTFVSTLHMMFYATLILLHRPYSHQSPHNTNDWTISLSICTSAANNTIEIASNLMRTTDEHRDVPRLKCLLHMAVFIFFTAGLVHINNCTSLDPVLAASAKLRTVETLRCLNVIEDVWISGKWCGNNIKNLLKSRNIELPCSVEGMKSEDQKKKKKKKKNFFV
ncbi:fungal-specific transcription factor domain-domain-containing protein [Lobosporangium transversale]|uniref:Fungal-specific transcription factor domain-domain-containing protein n=1 Tax=Lobosporangium transversale TaxID=64571 RepID=A0A1Y2GD43_9FUNG|nr:fungal-specific transcription factor domain-domain-containing protein [Lobosporangium transversale]ORZ05725.1 fungal-specific transcription factor domain-domain-containing protein [Lobosporangium transversale]|eukprot:XP_021877212.1 fungal-specific transcription factor domain-domain-containing protein [Lobosporangium transversale]